MPREKTQNIMVFGKRWFDRVNGNTYYSVDAYVNGKHVGRIDYGYGYGDEYLQAATSMLARKGYLPGIETYQYGGMETLWRYCERKGIRLAYDVADVCRKKNL